MESVLYLFPPLQRIICFSFLKTQPVSVWVPSESKSASEWALYSFTSLTLNDDLRGTFALWAAKACRCTSLVKLDWRICLSFFRRFAAVKCSQKRRAVAYKMIGRTWNPTSLLQHVLHRYWIIVSENTLVALTIDKLQPAPCDIAVCKISAAATVEAMVLFLNCDFRFPIYFPILLLFKSDKRWGKNCVTLRTLDEKVYSFCGIYYNLEKLIQSLVNSKYGWKGKYNNLRIEERKILLDFASSCWEAALSAGPTVLPGLKRRAEWMTCLIQWYL